MPEESLRDQQLTESNEPFIKLVSPDPYDADLEAYKVDEANDPYRKFTESINQGATIDLSVPCRAATGLCT